jgi:hypothetical protein
MEISIFFRCQCGNGVAKIHGKSPWFPVQIFPWKAMNFVAGNDFTRGHMMSDAWLLDVKTHQWHLVATEGCKRPSPRWGLPGLRQRDLKKRPGVQKRTWRNNSTWSLEHDLYNPTRSFPFFPWKVFLYIHNLAGGLEHFLLFPLDIVIPTAQNIFFRGVGLNHQPGIVLINHMIQDH